MRWWLSSTPCNTSQRKINTWFWACTRPWLSFLPFCTLPCWPSDFSACWSLTPVPTYSPCNVYYCKRCGAFCFVLFCFERYYKHVFWTLSRMHEHVYFLSLWRHWYAWLLESSCIWSPTWRFKHPSRGSEQKADLSAVKALGSQTVFFTSPECLQNQNNKIGTKVYQEQGRPVNGY